MEATAHAHNELAGKAPSLAVLLGSRSHTDQAVDVLDAVQEMVEAGSSSTSTWRLWVRATS